ncbi:MAG: putative Succinyl-CoA ligase [ADP-forming] subunit alpha [Promethearchaeota archaeon]|nr:MAG: putative Succinyl-CoA ligase [ADP-forming] subunit alpha [Candidatus Lokiarchaeota archaeon]
MFSKNTQTREKIDYKKLFYPRAIGIIGASYNPAGGGYFVQVMKDRFKEPMYLFNPNLKGEELYGIEVYGSILEIPEDKPIDYVIIGVPARIVPNVLEQTGKKGVPFVTIFSSGFSEVGNEGLEEKVIKIAEEYGINIIGPNCIGVYCPESDLYFGRGQSKKAGNFGGVFQSGGLAVNVSQLAVSYGCYISKMVSIGNAIDLSHPHFLEYFLNDDKTAIIGLYLESLKNQQQGRRFMDAVKNLSLNRKPVLLWKSGFGEATKEAIKSHTGGLAGDNRIWKAMAKQTGCCLVDNSIELAALASAFKLTRLPATRNIGLIGIGGGASIEASDTLEKYNLKIPKLTNKTAEKMSRFLPEVNTSFANPLDLGAMGALPHIYYRTIITLDKDPNIDAIVFVKDPERFAGLEKTMISKMGFKDGVDLTRTFVKYIGKAKRTCTKPMYCVMLKISEGFEEYKSRYRFKLKLLNRNVPVYENFDLVSKVLDRLCTYREFLQAHGKYPRSEK